MRLVLLFDFLHDEKTGIKEPIHTVDETALFAARKATGNGAGYAPCEKSYASWLSASHTSGENGFTYPSTFQ